jgi:hypothetical protein
LHYSEGKCEVIPYIRKGSVETQGLFVLKTTSLMNNICLGGIKMAKIYAVCGSNGMCCEEYCWWISRIFTSEKAAKKYIRNLSEVYAREDLRRHELNILKYSQGLTDDEEEELQEYINRWFWHNAPNTNYWIEPYELLE